MKLLAQKMFVAFLAASSLVHASVDVDLARAVEKAAKGELRERELLQRLERGFATTGELSKRIQIAGVLTYAPQSSGLRERYVEFLLGQSQAESILGKKEMFRLHRLRGELLFEQGKFSLARRDFEFLMGVSDPLVREYAVLKAGWCYMNEDAQHLAWQLWIEQAEKAISEKQTLPPNLAHSLGQSLVENPKRTSDDFRRLGQLKLDTASLASVLKGMEQGADVIDTSEKIKRFVDEARSLKWADLLASRLLEELGGTGSRACLFLPWVMLVSKEKEVPALSYQVSESCLVWLTVDLSAKGKKAKPKEREWANTVQAASGLLKAWVPTRMWEKSQLRVPFSFYSLDGQSAFACETGLSWITEPGSPEHRTRAPIAEIAEQCKKAVVDPANAEKLGHFFDPNSGTIPYLSNAKDPVLFIALALLEQPAFEAVILNSLKIQSQKYEGTLLPVLVLEKWESSKQYAASEALWEVLVRKQADDPAQSSAWRQILQRRVKQMTSEKATPEQVRQLLERTLLVPSDPNLSEFGYGLWLQYLALEVALARRDPLTAEKSLAENVPARAVATGLLSSARARAFPKLGSATVEMLAWFGMWNPLWETVTGPSAVPFTTVRSEALEVRLLSALVKGEITPTADVVVKDPSLKFILELGTKLKEAPGGDWLDGLKPTGNSVVARDAMYLQSLAKRKKGLLGQTKGSKAAAKQALDWITFLDQKKREIAKRTWCHEVFFNAAQESIVGFCEKASERVPSLKQAVQGAGSSEAQWNEFFVAFEKKLDRCRIKADSRRASL